MRNRKLFSTVMATTLAVTTMAMPVMAADGEVDVNLTTKKAVMRVQVPTSMAVEIDQYAIDEAGCQIACVDEFDMKNLSEMAVKVVVDSTVTLKSGVTLASGKEAASGSASGDVAWLAVAAQTSGDVYDDKNTTDVETCGTLSELNANVTTFSQSSATEGKAEQTFYLAKGNGTPSYKMVTSGDAAKVKFARFYELTGEMASGDAVREKVKESDVYVASGDVITKYEKGATITTFADGTHKGYVISGDATDATGNGKYMYGEMANADGKGEAAFRYVGNLSEVNGEQWSKEKIQGIHIAYDITGVTADTYTEAEKQCTYGLYKEKPADIAPSLASAASVQVASGTPVTIKLDLGAGSKKANQAISMIWKETNINIGTDPNVSYDVENAVITINDTAINNLLADESNFPVTLEITFDDSENTKVEVTLTK